MIARPPLLFPIMLVAALGACGKRSSEVDRLDRELVGNASAPDRTDPALAGALEDQIMVDPALAQQANGHSVRPADAPVQAPVPPGVMPGGDAAPRAARPTPGELAQARGVRADCYASLDYSHGWANRLPAGVPLYPDAAVDEAAGRDAADCRVRVVSYASGAAVGTLVRFYLTQAGRAGYAAGHERRGGDEVVAGDRASGDGAFYVAITPRGTGSAVDLVVNEGR